MKASASHAASIACLAIAGTGNTESGLGNVHVLAAVCAGQRPNVPGGELLLSCHAIARASMAAAKRLNDVLYKARIAGEIGTNRMLWTIALDRLAAPDDAEEGGIFDCYSGIDFG